MTFFIQGPAGWHHTGEAGRPIGQSVALVASAGGTVLVCTGLSLAWRRLCGWRRRASGSADLAALGRGQEVSAD